MERREDKGKEMRASEEAEAAPDRESPKEQVGLGGAATTRRVKDLRMCR